MVVDPKTDAPRDFYSFLVHKLSQKFQREIDLGKDNNPLYSSYLRLHNFVLERSYIKKAIMTIPYNASAQSMVKYIVMDLHKNEELSAQDRTDWYSKKENLTGPMICLKDISLLVSCIHNIVTNDFVKINKLRRYLKTVATIFTALGLPIVWTQPQGLEIRQSYLAVESISIRPFAYSKIKLNIQVTKRDAYDKNKQIRALMPNLIHSLDATSLSLLFKKFDDFYNNSGSNFLSIHDCFGTTFDKVAVLKTLLSSVYIDLYSNESYLHKFDGHVLDSLNNAANKYDPITKTFKGEFNLEKRIYTQPRTTEDGDIEYVKYKLHDINWVTNNKMIGEEHLKEIDSQYILI